MEFTGYFAQKREEERYFDCIISVCRSEILPDRGGSWYYIIVEYVKHAETAVQKL